MGAKVCLILGILLLSHVLIPTEATARAMPQTAEELKSEIDAGGSPRIGYKPITRPVGSKGKPYPGRGCRSKYKCGRGPPGHV